MPRAGVAWIPVVSVKTAGSFPPHARLTTDGPTRELRAAPLGRCQTRPRCGTRLVPQLRLPLPACSSACLRECKLCLPEPATRQLRVHCYRVRAWRQRVEGALGLRELFCAIIFHRSTILSHKRMRRVGALDTAKAVRRHKY